MACDICDKKGTELINLVADYQTKDIACVCPECASRVNDHLWKLRAMSRKQENIFLKIFMKENKVNLATKENV
jgi:hypothetical protein